MVSVAFKLGREIALPMRVRLFAAAEQGMTDVEVVFAGAGEKATEVYLARSANLPVGVMLAGEQQANGRGIETDRSDRAVDRVSLDLKNAADRKCASSQIGRHNLDHTGNEGEEVVGFPPLKTAPLDPEPVARGRRRGDLIAATPFC